MMSSIKEKFSLIAKKRYETSGESLIRFYGMCQDSDGFLWLGTDGEGIFKTNHNGTPIKQYKADGRPGSITDNAILYGYTDRMVIYGSVLMQKGFCSITKKQIRLSTTHTAREMRKAWVVMT
jgi:hypothetical protein